LYSINTKNVIRILLISISSLAALGLRAQKIDSIYFHLYTDSLKKGTHNYINVDGKLSNGTWLPLTSKEVQFTSNVCHFSGNELVVPSDFNGDKITVKAVLKSNPGMAIERIIWIKTLPDGPLPTQDEVMKEFRKKGKRKRN
jgi:hypothetical protein